jgi:formylglycine-generating enzyme required for sulfatase activity
MRLEYAMSRIALVLMAMLPNVSFADDQKPPPEPIALTFGQSDAHSSRAEWAKHLNTSERKQLDLGKGVKLGLILIPPGKVRMGSSTAEREYVRKRFNVEINGEDEREVTISKPFYLAVTETTQEQYEALLGAARNISWFNPTGGGKLKGIDCAKYPVERVTWNDANYFCDDLNERHGGKLKARLPSEAEWEYACRAGSQTAFHFGDKLNGRAANCNGAHISDGDEAKGTYLERTRPVASYPANAFGLFDMHGNVCEWCLDYYGEETRSLGVTDPLRITKEGKTLRVLRGGGWDSSPHQCRAACRAFAKPDQRDNARGFRICIPIE